MDDAVSKVVNAANAKLRALLRAKRFMCLADVVLQYKSQVLPLIEFYTAAIFHASNTILAPLDKIQNRFIAEVGLSEQDAFVKFNVCPLRCRRDVAMLGLIHKIVLGLAHPTFSILFPFADLPAHVINTRLRARRHNKQILDRCDGSHSAIMHRSLFGLVNVYNLLPQAAVDCTDVSSFQRFLNLSNCAQHVCHISQVGQVCFHQFVERMFHSFTHVYIFCSIAKH